MNAISRWMRVPGMCAIVIGLVVASFGSGAMAATACNGVVSGSVADGVVVNAGSVCTLVNANVSNGVRVNAGGILIACGSVISGGLQANGAAEILVGPEEIDCDGDVINGGVTIANTGPGAFPPAPSIALERSRISGSVHVTGSQGMIAIADNAISGGLFCGNNAFDPEDEGMENVVTGQVRCDFQEGDE